MSIESPDAAGRIRRSPAGGTRRRCAPAASCAGTRTGPARRSRRGPRPRPRSSGPSAASGDSNPRSSSKRLGEQHFGRVVERKEPPGHEELADTRRRRRSRAAAPSPWPRATCVAVSQLDVVQRHVGVGVLDAGNGAESLERGGVERHGRPAVGVDARRALVVVVVIVVRRGQTWMSLSMPSFLSGASISCCRPSANAIIDTSAPQPIATPSAVSVDRSRARAAPASAWRKSSHHLMAPPPAARRARASRPSAIAIVRRQ